MQSAAAHLVADVPTADPDERVQAVIDRLHERRYASIETIFVVDEERKFLGGIAIGDLLAATSERTAGELANPESPMVRVTDDQEHVASTALDRRALSVAVLDRGGCFIGGISPRSLLMILREEHVSDLHRLAGIRREAVRDREALEGPPIRRARHRLPWLLLGLAGSMLAAVIISRFERVLAEDLAIAFFVPAIVYLADAIGTQTEAIAVRGISISRTGLGNLVASELRTGLMIGVTLAALAFPIVAFGFGSGRLAIAVAAAIICAGSVATTIGLLLPWLLHRFGYDPAFGSGPVATIIQDLLSLLIYLVLATRVL
ncbi:MAG TPA: magnesium transporter [Kofleriaceae bacterium]